MSQFYTSVVKRGRNLLYRGYDNGKLVQRKIPFKPTLYTPTQSPTKFRSIYGGHVTPQTFDNMREASQFVQMYEDVDNYDVYGTTDYVCQYVQETWPTHVPYDESLINVSNIDIEVDSDDGFPEPDEARHPVNSIAILNGRTASFKVFSMYDYKPEKTELNCPYPIEHEQFDTEIDLLSAFLTYWNSKAGCPDIVTGWNVVKFDIVYLINRITLLMGEDKARLLSPWGLIQKRTVPYKGKELTVYELVGITQLDMMDLFQKFGVYQYGPQESWSLNHIAYVVLGERKLSFKEHDSLHALAANDPQKFVDYNIKDVLLVHQIAEETGLLSLVIEMAYAAGVNYDTTLGTVRIWDSIIYRFAREKGLIVQPAKKNFGAAYPGGYVKAPIPGKYRWVVSFDLNSLYPNIIAEYNMSPETIMQERVPLDVETCMARRVPKTAYVVAANGTLYDRTQQGLLPQLIVEYYERRKARQAAKKSFAKSGDVKASRQAHTQQMAIKILMNSLYGALGSPYFRHYDLRMAEAITLSGQLTIMWAERTINEYLNKALKTSGIDYVIAIDTDSNYVDMSRLVDTVKPKDPVAFLDQFSKEVMGPLLKQAFTELGKQQNTYIPRMVMGREAIAQAGFWVAKKNYALLVNDLEGERFSDPYMKIAGLAAIKSDTPELCRNWMKETFKVILTKTEADTQQLIKDKRSVFNSLEPEEIAKNSGVSNVKKYMDKNTLYKSGTPINSKAAIVYNHVVKTAGINNKYDLIGEGDKMSYLSLVPRNPLKQKVIGFKEVFPRELGLEKYIDYNALFHKTYLKPVTNVLTAIGWEAEPVNRLDGWM